MSDGRFALVTGGAQGMGFAAAKRFLELGFGGVLLLDRNAAKLAEAASRLQALGQVETLAGDLMDVMLPARAVSAAVSAFGGLNVLVNAAGNTERCGLDDTSPEAFDRLFAVNTRAPLFMMQEAVKAMRPNRSGTIINMSSMLSHGGPPNLTTYSASKAALNILTRSSAQTVARDGIRIFAINLGWVNSDGEHALQTGFHNMPQDWAEAIGRRMPAGRMITPDDVAGLVAYLVSPSAQMMTGAIIDYEQMPVAVFEQHPALSPE
ncbi:MAG: SDR family oxidoreductase [Aestuariivirga sp.]|uniref:oxidoreductase n=1 Tax=Aestuariivirga sp. TaxID=2650926 RepID=UPI0025C3EE77|nr:oxidoreductase [Aestuariivirga sp.]MCA3560613.1 SDR family oxidoreductase [Aestuariivirga sp.]